MKKSLLVALAIAGLLYLRSSKRPVTAPSLAEESFTQLHRTLYMNDIASMMPESAMCH